VKQLSGWKLGRARLLFLASVLDIADKGHELGDEKGYDQGKWVNECGSPACALGHYAAQYPKRFVLNPNWVSPVGGRPYPVIQLRGSDARLGPQSTGILEEFSITSSESEELFSGSGCGDATTAKEAAAYIRKFVARKDREMRPARVVKEKKKAKRAR
jgi:hypothetical protein